MMDGKEINFEAKVNALVEQLATVICSRDVVTRVTVTEKGSKTPTTNKRKSTTSATNNKDNIKETTTPSGLKSARHGRKDNNETPGSHSPSHSPVHKRVKLSAQSSDSPDHKEV